MSKLYDEYRKLKIKDENKLYIFKSGMFYIALEEDAKTLSEMFDFKIVKLNENVVKSGFPISRLEYYLELLNKRNINFEIIDGNYSKIENYEDYMNNCKLKKIIIYINNLDLDNVTFKEAYNYLEKLKNEIKKVYKVEEII